MWLHLNLSHTGALAWMRENAALSDNFYEALHEGSRSTRIERDGESLFRRHQRHHLRLQFRGQRRGHAVAGRQRAPWSSAPARGPLRAIDRLRTAVKRGEELATSTELLDHLLRDQADELQRIVRGSKRTRSTTSRTRCSPAATPATAPSFRACAG